MTDEPGLCGYATKHLRQIIQCSLRVVGLYSLDAENLLMGTAAAESHLGLYTRQLAGGVARGIYQMEPATLDDVYANYLLYRPPLKRLIEDCTGVTGPNVDRLEHDPIYATVIARVQYLRKKAPIPSDLSGQAKYWKQHWNTEDGAGSAEKYIRLWKAFVGEAF